MNPHLVVVRNIGLTVGAGVLVGCGLHTWILKRMNSFDQRVLEHIGPSYSAGEMEQLHNLGYIYRLERRNRSIYRIKAMGIASCLSMLGIVLIRWELLRWPPVASSAEIISIELNPWDLLLKSRELPLPWDALAVVFALVGIHYFYQIPYMQSRFLNKKSKLKFYIRYLKSR